MIGYITDANTPSSSLSFTARKSIIHAGFSPPPPSLLFFFSSIGFESLESRVKNQNSGTSGERRFAQTIVLLRRFTIPLRNIPRRIVLSNVAQCGLRQYFFLTKRGYEFD